MNRFALLADEGDSGDESPAVQQKVTPKAVAPTPAAAPIPGSAAAGRQQQQRASKSDYPARGGRKVYGGDRPAEATGDGAEITKDARSSYGENRGGRGGRGAGRSRGAPRSGNRQFDRHSQTNHVDSQKQEHQAWGGDDGKRELNDETAGQQDAAADASGAATPVPATLDGGEGAATPSRPVPQPEPEDNTKTYAEYLAEQAERNLKLNAPSQAPRKANEGADDAQWKDAVALSKKDEDDAYFAGSKENKSRKRPTKEGKTYIEVEARFPRPGGDRGGRGGRGRGEGGRGRGDGSRGRGAPRAPRAPQQSAAALDTSDNTAFPSLS